VHNSQISAELARVRDDFAELVTTAGDEELKAGTNGTRWTNEQLLFHMLFGYLLVRVLLFLVRVMGRLPDGVSRAFAAALNAATRPFHVVNYLGSLGGGRVLGRSGMVQVMDRVTRSLERSLDAEPPARLERGMHFPIGWDPYFRDWMSLRDVYHYPTQHYQHHRRQLTLAAVRP
jgi:hypothetical protein